MGGENSALEREKKHDDRMEIHNCESNPEADANILALTIKDLGDDPGKCNEEPMKGKNETVSQMLLLPTEMNEPGISQLFMVNISKLVRSKLDNFRIEFRELIQVPDILNEPHNKGLHLVQKYADQSGAVFFTPTRGGLTATFNTLTKNSFNPAKRRFSVPHTGISGPFQFKHVAHLSADNTPKLLPTKEDKLIQWNVILSNLDSLRKMRSKPWRDGIPWELRWIVWRSAIGDNLNITQELYSIMREHTKMISNANAHSSSVDTILDDKNLLTPPSTPTRFGRPPLGCEASISLIPMDLSRTISITSSKSRICVKRLREILEAFVCYRPDVGYVQGMSYVISVLAEVENGESEDDGFNLFVGLSNVLHRKVLRTFYSMDPQKTKKYINVHKKLMQQHLPNVFNHFQTISFDIEMYLYEWFLTCYAQVIGRDLLLRVWDRLIIEGETILFAVSIVILKFLEVHIIHQPFETVALLLTRGVNTIGNHLQDIELFLITLDGLKLTPGIL